MFCEGNSDFAWSLKLLENYLMKMQTIHNFGLKRGKLILDQLKSEGEICKLFCGSIDENRSTLKRCMALCLKYRYGYDELDSDFLVYLPVNCLGKQEEEWPIEIVYFKKIIRKVEKEWARLENASIILVHGYVDVNGNITIFNVENITKRPKSIIVYKKLKPMDIETQFKSSDSNALDFLSKFIGNLEKPDHLLGKSSIVASQEFIIPKRRLKILSTQSYWTVNMEPFKCQYRVLYEELADSFDFAVKYDIIYLIIFSVYVYCNAVKSVGFFQYRHTSNLLRIPFSGDWNIGLKFVMSLGLLGCQAVFGLMIFSLSVNLFPYYPKHMGSILFILNTLCYFTEIDLGRFNEGNTLKSWTNILAPVELCHNIILYAAFAEKCNVRRMLYWIKHATNSSLHFISKKVRGIIKSTLFNNTESK
ncbi:predicted protein [Naegleria gruberi]|uniref:Predicted protein n=1 Tax=Naegleria gruberi TaxID=5762 RepID=D2VET6_NAEGR|nr:uncharacterized protein NAEGRDRAFT_67388 [Naegleria gruberi]EFC44660.1 predicted protein [Naegleria gruberi]|eukprot:XP_002677404.1 predicted protein [Naegleria gruberi strain NEG-M]